MGEVGIHDRVGAILRERDDRHLVRAVGRREGARSGEYGQAEAVVEADDSLKAAVNRLLGVPERSDNP